MGDAEKDLEDVAALAVKNLSDKLTTRSIELAGAHVELAADQVLDLVELSVTAVKGLLGSERHAAHAKAQLSLQSFSGQARSYMELVEFREAFTEALTEVAKEIVTEGAPVVLAMLLGALGGAA